MKSFLKSINRIERMKNMITKIIFAVITGLLLLGICIWSYRLSNVDNTGEESKESEKEGDRA